MENLNKNASENVLKMNIQLLASEGEQNTDNNVDNQDNVQDNTNIQENQQEKEKTFTQDDIDRIIAKKFKQWEKNKAKEKEEIEEAERLKRMSESERQEAEMKKQLEEFNKMKAEMAREKLSNQVVKELATRDLPIEYAEYVMVDGDADATMDRLKVFAEKYKADIQAAVDKQVQERLKGNVPKSSVVEQKGEFTVEDVKKMSAAEINKNWDKIKHLKLN